MDDSALILYLEDNPRDAELVRDTLQQTPSLSCELRVARNRAEYEAALAEARFDLVLSDYALPDYDGMAALALAHAKQPHVPFILISGTLGEERAVDCVLRGATDYVLKQRLERLVPAVLRALAEANDHQKRREAEESLRESELKYRDLVENLNDVIFTVDLQGTLTYVSAPARQLIGYAPDELVGRSFREIIHPDDLPGLDRRFREILENRIEPWEFRYRTKDGETRWAHTSSRPIFEAGRPVGIRGLFSNITARKAAEAGRDRLLHRQATVNRVTLALGALTEVPAVLRTLHDEVRTLLDADGFFLSRYDKDTGLITALFAVDGDVERDVSTFPPVPLAPEGRGMQSQVLRTGKPLNVPDWIEGERRMQTVHHIAAGGTFTPPPPETERESCTKSALLVPMIFLGEPVGVLQVQSNRLSAYSDEDVDLLAGLANAAAISIQNAQLVAEAESGADRLRRSLEGALRAVSHASETRDPYTAGHQRRVTHLATAIARELRCSDEECDTLRIAGMTHDIGKLAIPAEILSKPALLSSIEQELIRTHPEAGYGILADIPFPGPVADIVLQHHERLDGSGYPHGLTGKQMLRGARILAVADVVEAMASHRPYRPARGIDAALGEIEQSAGRLYDSEAVEACLRLFRDKGYALPA
jgi:PAS domain S-box-containing protein/putative nucleotidyltransferase with HDIG domain